MKAYAIIGRVIFSIMLAVWAVSATGAQAAEIKVLSSNGVHSVLVELLPEFEQATGNKVVITYDTANLVLKRIKGGEKADLVIITRPTIDQLIKDGKVAKGGGKNLAKSGVGVAIQAGLPKPDISTPEAFKQAILKAKSITFTGTGASGIHFMSVAKKLGVADQVKAKAKIPAGGAVGPLVAKGEAEMAVQQIPELMAVKEIQFVGPLPKELQKYTLFTAAVMKDAKQPKAAKALLDYILKKGAPLFKAKGFEP
jgi:molybdate transport system substrate-binding protein